MTKEQFEISNKLLVERLAELEKTQYEIEAQLIENNRQHGMYLKEMEDVVYRLYSKDYKYTDIDSMSVIISASGQTRYLMLDGISLHKEDKNGMYKEINAFDTERDEWVKLVCVSDKHDVWILMKIEDGEHTEIEYEYFSMSGMYNIKRGA